MKTVILTIAAGASALATTAASAAPGDELAGNSAEVVRSDGARGRILFARDGSLRFTGKYEGHGFDTDGGWTLANGQLCWDLRNHVHECWVYPQQLMFDAPTMLRSADGPLGLRFTVRYGTGAVMPKDGAFNH
ncbi:MAG: hypothetical protein JOY99_06825 [Sphingomonadaceae bacterium]|nr:hypothetical protein [Sphingomonadaceae bacterium]